MRRTHKMTRALALLLMLVTLVTSMPITAFAVDTADASQHTNSVQTSPDHAVVTVLHEGAEKSVVTLHEGGQEVLTSFVAGAEPTKRTWQILIPLRNQWIDIYGQNGETLTVTEALIGSMLNDEECAYIRSSVQVGESVFVSKSVGVALSHDASNEEKPQAALPARRMLASKNSGVSLAAEEEEFQTVTIVINYIFDNGGIAFEPYGASVAKGSDFSRSVPSPTVVGYDPFIRIGDAYVDASTVELNYTNLTESVTLNVIYEPAIVKFEVHHHLQDLYDDAYSLHPDFVTEGKALTGSIVPEGLAMTETELPGFKPLAYEKLTVAADGSTVVEIRYDRNYYLIDFDMQGGYGTDPVYIRYGSSVGANPPIRHGYIFDGWDLISYGGVAPSAVQKSQYDINAATITVPDANLTYRAKWITQLVKYTMVFWKENIDNTGFSYWGYMDDLQAMSGSYVSGADRISEIGGIDDEAHFTYNDTLTDKNVLVEGDGSTIVNVYYTRNRYTITFKATGLCVIPEKHSHTDACYQLLCTKGHVHSEECGEPQLNCGLTEHLEHTEACVICGLEEHTHSNACCGLEEHTHTTSCFNSVGNSANPTGAPSGVEDGYIFAVRSFIRYNYYIFIGGAWYSYSGRNVSSGDVVEPTCKKENHTHGSADCSCSKTVHIHSDTCYSDTLHQHREDCYTYSCGGSQHVHTDSCYILHCGIPTGHTHNNTCKNAKSSNTVKLVYRKYQQSLEDIWPITDDNGVTYDSGERWNPSDSNTYSAVLVYIANMPGENFTLTLNKSSNDTYTMNYYLEVLDGDPYDVSYNGKEYILYTTIKANYNYITKAEDFFDIHGYYQNESNPKFGNNGQIDLNGGGTVNFYYGRIVDHHLEFQSNGVVLNEHTQYGLPYGQSLKGFDFVPEYPASLEPNAYTFAGWYTSPGHYDGTEVDWDTITMDAGDVLLYAKWAPITHTVSVYLDSSLSEQIGDVQYISHGHFAHAPTETVENGNYIFQGWFYRTERDGQIEERAFVFTGIPIMDDMQIYAKWSSHVTVNYTINYVLYETGEAIADPTVGSGIAGHNKTFYAKAGNDLYMGYREGYYPLTSSHTVTMSAEVEEHVYTFEYVYVESMPYLVRYLDENGNAVYTEKRVDDNSLSVVTETFVKVEKMMPDAYQKRLVLSASGEDADGDGVFDSNVITFRYSSDEEHAYYRVVHYIENIAGDGYREHRSEDLVGLIGLEYTVPAISITGFSFNGAITSINGQITPTTGTEVKATLTTEGLLFELYYDRVDVGYTVRYLESGTNRVLYEEKKEMGIFGEQIVEYSVGLGHLGYTLVGDSVKTVNLSTNEASNIIDFYYQEAIYSLKYEIVGTSEAGTLSMSSENITAVTGQPTGSIPYVSAGYHYVGWYLDAACTCPVPAEWVDSANYQLLPQSDGVWLANQVYYVKIDPDFTSLTINTIGCADVDEGQIFLFRVKGVSEDCANVDLTVTVVGNGSVTIEQLRVGSYTVTELKEWSYRYTPDSASKDIELSVNVTDNRLTFSHIRSVTKWLDGNDNNINDFN